MLDFPNSRDDVLSVEYGEGPNYYCYFWLSAVLLNSRDHSAIEIEFNNRLDPPLRAEGRFFILCEPATINTSGQRLLDWSKDISEKLTYAWENA